MRISCDPEDPDYTPFPESSTIQIFLDGVEQSPKTNGRGVVFADDATGELIFCEQVDGDLSYRPFKTEGDKIATFTAYGSVKIVRSQAVSKMDYAADDVAGIAKRLKEIRENERALECDDVDKASGHDLRLLAQRYGAKWCEDDSDYAVRGAIKGVIERGE